MSAAYPRSTGQRWGTYSRISDDPLDTQRGVTRQQHDTAQAVRSRGHEVAHEYVENDTSAYRKRRVARTDDTGSTYYVYRTVRPVWQQALTDLREGRIDGLMVWDLDRLARDPRDLEDAIEVVEHHGRAIAGETGSIDLGTDAGRAMARVLTAMNNKASADTGRRVARAALESAHQGKPTGKRAFGWDEDKLALHPVEAPLARAAIDDLIRGARTPGRIASDWNEAGALTAHYRTAWTSAKVRQYLRNPRLAGYRTYRGEFLHDADGNVVMGQWEPLVTPETWQLLQQALGTPTENRYRVPHKFTRHYLLTGLIRCGVCNRGMYGNRDARRGGFSYRCTHVRHGAERHTVSIAGEETDQAVLEVVKGFITNMGTVTSPDTEFPGQAELRNAERKISELMGAFNRDELPASVVFPAVKDHEAALTRLRNAHAQWTASRVTSSSADTLAARFTNAETTGEQRAVVEAVLEAVLIKPPRPEFRRQHDPGRIAYVWR